MAKASPKSHKVRVGSVTIQVTPWRHPSGRNYWRFWWYDTEGKRKCGTRASKSDALEDARLKAKEIHNGKLDITELDEQTKRLIRRFLDAKPTDALLDKFLAWQEQKQEDVLLKKAIKEMLEIKERDRGRSERHIRDLRGNLKNLLNFFGDESTIGSIKVTELEKWISEHKDLSPHRRKNLRGSAVNLWRWSREQGYLPEKKTEAEKLSRPQIEKKIQQTYTRDEIKLMLEACPQEHLPWLVLSAFCGLRYEELVPPFKSNKRPLDWSDLRWEKAKILVHPETAKLKEKRWAHLPENAQAWLAPLRKNHGRITPTRPPNKVLKHEGSVTNILGELVGGWRPNALRNSFISYRASLIGLGLTAKEAGNSENECRRSYNDDMTEEEGKAWFAVSPK